MQMARIRTTGVLTDAADDESVMTDYGVEDECPVKRSHLVFRKPRVRTGDLQDYKRLGYIASVEQCRIDLVNETH